MAHLQRVLSLILSLALIALPIGSAQAALIDNDQLINPASSGFDREALLQVLDREEARQQLTSLGASPEEVKARIQHMTDQEVAQLNQHLADLPAGEGILEVILILFIVFVITDAVGATDIFPFVHPVR